MKQLLKSILYLNISFISLSSISITYLKRYNTFSYSMSIFGIVLSTATNPSLRFHGYQHAFCRTKFRIF